jgi:anti-sigma factor RsiW
MSDQMNDRDPLAALLRESLPRHEAPRALRDWAVERARAVADAADAAPAIAPDAHSSRAGGRSRAAYAASLAAALLIGWMGATTAARIRVAHRAPDAEVAELFDTHLRSLQLDHLIDVQSTDRHTVKPWFAGKTDISPRVLDLASSGFPLIGGRLDYFGGHPAPVLVYGRRQHVINLFIWRPSPGEDRLPSPRAASRDGYHALQWSDGDLAYCAVSDVDPADLVQFREAYIAGR